MIKHLLSNNWTRKSFEKKLNPNVQPRKDTLLKTSARKSELSRPLTTTGELLPWWAEATISEIFQKFA